MTRPFLPHPKNWKTKTLEPKKGSNFIISVSTGSTPSTSVSKFWDGDIPWLTPKDITNTKGEIFVSQTDRNITKIGLQNSGTKLLSPRTVMLTKRAPVGIVMINSVPMTTNQGFLNFSCGEDLDPVYLCFWFRCNKLYLDSVANGSTYPELYLSDLFEFEISVPKISEQKKISEFLLSLETSIRLGEVLEGSSTNPAQAMGIKKETEELERFRNIIVPKLFAGESTVKKLQTPKST